MNTKTPFFAGESRLRQLRSEAREWSGTPFHAHGKFKHIGVDCVWLAAEIYRVLGVVPLQKLPRYTVGAGSHLEASKVAEGVAASGAFEGVTPADIETVRPGDLLGFKLGRVIHHVGIVVEGTRFIHAIATIGVTESDLRDPTWGRRLGAIWRPIEG
jgi:probable lipoprotein NlpC